MLGYSDIPPSQHGAVDKANHTCNLTQLGIAKHEHLPYTDLNTCHDSICPSLQTDAGRMPHAAHHL